jgi:hypothetical protein
MRALAEPANDRLMFAGEATNPEWFGTVQGRQSFVPESEP